MSDLRMAALDYARRGQPVFPVEPRGKRPLGKLAPSGYKNGTTGEALIRAWWAEYPDANIGLPTGHWADVIDLDGAEGMDSWGDAEGNQAMLCCPVVATARGCHLYVRPTGLGNRAGVLPGVDFRGRGGYVVGAPSVHSSGSRYTWAPYEGPDTPLPEVPAWFLALLNPKPVARVMPIARSTLHPGTPGVYAETALRDEIAQLLSAGEGARNDTLNKSAYSLGQIVGAGLLDAYVVADALILAATSTGLGEQEARNTVASGLRSGMQSPREVA